jgi:hypothetical protein
MKLFTCFIFVLFPVQLFAYAWPVFIPPTKELLIALGIIDASHCPPGWGKLISGSSINIHDYSCDILS